MANFTAIVRGIAQRVLAITSPTPDGTETPNGVRTGRFNELFSLNLWAKQHGLADEESSFVMSGTLGTGVATIAALTGLVDTSPFIIAKNIADPSTGIRSYLDLLKLICTVAGTAGTALRYGVKVGPSRQDPTGMDAAFNPTLAAPTGVPQNVQASSQRQSILRVYAGALVAPAAQGGTRQLGGGLLKSAIPVANDQYIINFGGIDPAAPATQVDRNDAHPSVVIPPGYSAFIHIWLPSQSAASSYEIQLHHHER
jgi:hypothetical protein